MYIDRVFSAIVFLCVCVSVCVQISLDNPSSKPLTYHALLRGEDANKFSIVGGADTITVSILHCN